MIYVPQFTVINSHHGIKINWTESEASDFSHYTIEMSDEVNGVFKKVGQTNVNNFTTKALQGAASYYFIIYSWDIYGNRSEPSDTIEVIL